MKYNYCNTTKVYFENKNDELNNFIRTNKYKRILFITGGKHTESIAKRIIEELPNVNHLLLTGVLSNPRCEKIEDMYLKAKGFSPDLIITVGGGSVHDSGKAVSLLLCNKSDILRDYTVDGRLSVQGIERTIPIITIPTVFGSGAEVSPAALVKIGNMKKVIFSPKLHPLATFVNVDYSKSLPIMQISRSAFDALIQGTEGILSNLSNNISDSFATIAIKHFNYSFPFIINETINDDVLEKLAISSIFSSYVCSTAGVGAIHAISDPLSGKYDIHHGTALAMVTLDVLKYNFSDVDTKKIELLDSLLYNVPSANTDIRERVIEKYGYIISKLELMKSIDSFHIPDCDIKSIVTDSFNPDMNGNPHEFSKEEIFNVVRKYTNA